MSVNGLTINHKRLCQVIAGLLLPAITVLTGASEAAEISKPTKPNIIVLLTDDMGWSDVSIQGGSDRTPNIDRLAREGQRWTNFYVSSAISSPSRGGLLTGRVEPRTGLYGARLPVFIEGNPNGIPQSEVTLADMLSANGYATTILGKWHLGDQADALPTRHGFDTWFGIPGSNDMWSRQSVNQLEYNRISKIDPEQAAEIRRQRSQYNLAPKQEYWGVPLYESFHVDGKAVDYLVPGGMQQSEFTHQLTERATQYIGEHKDKPFFMYVAYAQTHVPIFSRPEYKGKGHNRYGDAVLEIDASVGSIMDALRKAGIDDNTLVVFTSDNGPWIPYQKYGLAGSATPLRDGKSTVWEGGSRVPFIAYWKGKIQPAVIDGIGSTLDFMPTFARISGSQLPQVPLDGVDLTSTLFDSTVPGPRKAMPYFYRGELAAWREGEYKLVFGESNKVGRYQTYPQPKLYHLNDDVSEKHDLASIEPEKVKLLQKEAQKYLLSLGEKKPGLFDF
ncbi:sulfatase [Citrobacter farmeri]|uniref:sulfatase family protein n=1 Tax=Citrobacter farmeri TaxID=67824 RepID=UPI00190816C7|nr:sulfatase [Citrobacter farmeri]MBJ9164591.1 sulfatase [Citrobacter farmeri]